ncbi:MAG: asparagine synthase (glutamine-hydrolyzing) [Bacilli bacterium]
MCGFVGFINKQTKKEKQTIIKNMADKIIHRGPNSEGYYCDDSVALGFRRLSIIDVEGGTQPIYNEKKDKLIFFNGEIYNHLEIREDLIKKGYKFRTNTDTESIILGYEEYGEKIVDKLRGMWAFVIWDINKKELFGSRDIFGIKPFYYAKMNDTIMLGSEIKSFLVHPNFKKEINEEALRPYLTFQFPAINETFFKGVFKLKPGHNIKIKNNKIEVKKYYQINFESSDKSMEELKKEIKKSLTESVNLHKVADVKLGSFLSGGVDSSYIVKELMPHNTFSVGFEREHFNEIDQAKGLSDLLKIENINHVISGDEFFDSLEKAMYHSDEPHANASSIALYSLANLASNHVTVTLSGEGADEVFGGNDTYIVTDRDLKYRKIPKFIRHSLGKIAVDRPWFHGRKFLMRNGLSPEEYYVGPAFIFNECEKEKVLNKEYLKGPTWKEIIKPIYDEVKDKDEVTKMKYCDFNLWLPDDLLLKADKMTMASSIELRVPFLDKEVMNLAQTIPVEYEIKDNISKFILRECANDILPTEWAKRPKWGFPVPFHYWIREDKYYNKVKEEFNKDYANIFFKVDYLNKLLEDHKNKKCENGRKIYIIYMFLLWYKVYFIDNVYEG